MKIGLNVPLSKNRRKKLVSILKATNKREKIPQQNNLKKRAGSGSGSVIQCHGFGPLAQRNGSGTHRQKFLFVLRFEFRYEERRQVANPFPHGSSKYL